MGCNSDGSMAQGCDQVAVMHDRQDESVRMRAREMKAIADACKRLGINGRSLKMLIDAGKVD